MDTSKWTDQLDRVTAEFQKHFGHLTPAQLNARPNAETWSIAQNIDHLIVTNRTYFPVLEQVRKGNNPLPFTARIGFMLNFFGKLILGSVQPDRKRKIKTFPIWQPGSSELNANILKQFIQHQEELKQIIRSSSDLLDKGTVISSPANKNIVYRLETAFDILVAHEFRHLEQAKEVMG